MLMITHLTFTCSIYLISLRPRRSLCLGGATLILNRRYRTIGFGQAQQLVSPLNQIMARSEKFVDDSR